MTAAAQASARDGGSVLREAGGLPVLGWPALDGHGARVLVSTCRGGVSRGAYATLNLSFTVRDDPAAVLANRRRLAAAAGLDPADFVFARQVHGGRAQLVGAADRGRGTLDAADAVPDADALVTADPGTVLAILVGDCVPIVLLDPVARVLACVHAGWRGTVAGVTGAALAAMATLGSRPGDVLAGLGPAIAASRYQVGADVRDAVLAALGRDAAGRVLRPDGTGRWLLDLHAANRVMLIAAGVPDGQVHVAGQPTGPEPGLFFSDRTARPCGRFALVAWLAAEQGTGGSTGTQRSTGTQAGADRRGR